MLKLVEKIHRERLQQEFDRDRYAELQGLVRFEDAGPCEIAAVCRTDFRRVLLCKDEYRRLIYAQVVGQAPGAAREQDFAERDHLDDGLGIPLFINAVRYRCDESGTRKGAGLAFNTGVSRHVDERKQIPGIVRPGVDVVRGCRRRRR